MERLGPAENFAIKIETLAEAQLAAVAGHRVLSIDAAEAADEVTRLFDIADNCRNDELPVLLSVGTSMLVAQGLRDLRRKKSPNVGVLRLAASLYLRQLDLPFSLALKE